MYYKKRFTATGHVVVPDRQTDRDATRQVQPKAHH